MKAKLERKAVSATGAPKLRLQKVPSGPVFTSLFGDNPTLPLANPLDNMVYPEGVEAAALAEAQAIREAFQAKYRGELDSFRAAGRRDHAVAESAVTRSKRGLRL